MSIAKENLKILFMGTPEFAREHLKALVENNFNVVGVFSQPDKPSGRGMRLLPTSVKEYALSQNLPVFQPEKLKAGKEEVEQILNTLKPDVIIVVAYGKILPKYILDYPKYGCINVHGSLLPKYIGAAPIQWSIINGDTTTGVTIMYMDEGMDTGNMIKKAACEISPCDTYGTLHDKLIPLGSKTLIQVLDELCLNDGVLNSEVQPKNFTVAPMLTKDNSHIDFNNSAENIVNLIRGTNPFPTAWCKKDDTTNFKVYNAHIVNKEYKDAKIGEVVELLDKKSEIIVKAGKNAIAISEIQAPNSKKMPAGDFIRGNKIKVGDILY